MTQELIDKIRNRTARIGLGFVGLPLAVEKAKAGFAVTGFNIQADKVDKVNKGENYIGDIVDSDLQRPVGERRLSASTDFAQLQACDIVAICVPTLLDINKRPDLSYAVNSAKSIVPNLHSPMLIFLESTTYPGTTDEVLRPLLEEAVLDAPVHVVKSTREAEMTKILENAFRIVNCALSNEMAVICHKMRVDVWDVIAAAATKPFGFVPFTPGPGVGGHTHPHRPVLPHVEGPRARLPHAAHLHLPGSAGPTGRTVRNAAEDSEAGAARSEYAMTWTAGFVFKGQPFGGPGFKPVQIGLSNRCKHRRPFSIPGYFGQQSRLLSVGEVTKNWRQIL